MGQLAPDTVTPQDILAFWYPEGLERLVSSDHVAFWRSRMQGGMDAPIRDRYAEVTLAAARGTYDSWAETPRGRLALLLTLDQFPRSLWRGTAGAYAQDIKATRLALEGIANGHYAALDRPWEKNFYLIAIGHCEGPDHLDRMDRVVALADAMVAALDGDLRAAYAEAADQPRRVRDVIRRFGRHPHRNPVYGRVSTLDEEAYLAAGQFPHEREIAPPG